MMPPMLSSTLNCGDGISCDKTMYEERFRLGTKALDYFIQNNYTGPEKVDNDMDLLVNKEDEAYCEFKNNFECNENVKNLEMLYFAKTIFNDEKMLELIELATWQLLQTNYILQMIMDELSDVILTECESLIEKIHYDTKWYKDAKPYMKVAFHIEVVQLFLLYKRINEAEKHLEIAQSIMTLSLELQGAMGKRTKYQTKETALLNLNVKKEKDIFHPTLDCNLLPITVNSEDDVRLEKPKFMEAIQLQNLNVFEEVIILAKCHYLQMSQPKDNLAMEEILLYLDKVIESTKNWPVKMEALRQRSVFYNQNRRKKQHALSQLDSLIGEFKKEPHDTSRKYLIYASGLKPIWVFKQNLADAMLSSGMIKGALDLYLQLQLWEEVIVCYTILKLPHKAAEIIRQEIAKEPTVKLWCLLGDAEQNTDHYETAWKLSGEKSSRVQRHYGFYYFSKQQYAEAISHLNSSVELNNIQENVWIRLGFAYLQVENWSLAAKSYRHYCELEQHSFEAWNNLAKAYIKLGDKTRAYHALQDAIKCNYEKWEVWDNLMIICVDLGNFSEVIRCYHRILDLKNKHVDVAVLALLIKTISNDQKACEELLEQALQLLGRIAALIQTNADVWRLYAELTVIRKTELDYQKAAQYLLRAYRAANTFPIWFKSIETTKDMLQLCEALANTYLKCTQKVSIAVKRSMLGSAKFSLQSVITKVKQEKLEEYDTIADILMSVENQLKLIIEEFEKVKNTK